MKQLWQERIKKDEQNEALHSSSDNTHVPIEKPLNDIAKSYDNYYYNGKQSVYNLRFGDDKVLRLEKYYIRNSVLSVVNRFKSTDGRVKRLRLLDFGAGDGRLFPVFEELAAELKEKNIHLEVIALDPSKMGLEIYRDELEKKGFTSNTDFEFHHITTKDGGANGYRVGNMEKDNLTVQFIHSEVDDSMEHYASLIGDVHYWQAMFGVFSHIPTEAGRQRHMDMLHQQTIPGGELLVCVPTTKRFWKEQIQYEGMRAQHLDVGLATEHGDIRYCKFALPYGIEHQITALCNVMDKMDSKPKLKASLRKAISQVLFSNPDQLTPNDFAPDSEMLKTAIQEKYHDEPIDKTEKLIEHSCELMLELHGHERLHPLNLYKNEKDLIAANYYHLYKAAEFDEVIRQSGFINVSGVQALSITDPVELTRKPYYYHVAESWVSWLSPTIISHIPSISHEKWAMEHIAEYMIVNAKKLESNQSHER